MDAFMQAQLRREAEASVALDRDARVQTVAVYGKPEGWKTYQVTIGLKYRDEPHPLDDRLSPDGWIELWAPDERRAREIVNSVMDQNWAFLYDKERDPIRIALFPLGCMAHILSYNNLNNYQLIWAL